MIANAVAMITDAEEGEVTLVTSEPQGSLAFCVFSYQ